MKKYLLSGLTGAAALLLVVSPVAAFGNQHYRGMQPGLVIENDANINTNIEVVAGTGFNEQTAHGGVTSGKTYSPNRLRLSNTLFTGDASAYGEVTNEVNNGDNCDCYSLRGTKLDNDAKIDTQMKVKAVTDDNTQEVGGYVGSSSKTSFSRRHHRPTMGAGGSMEASNYAETGNAVAQGSVWNIVNSRYSMMQ